ncbi:hypothetical protein SAMN03097699_0769 [Flavobacteriaceae bacterium MAR_2010_188]|nr:hypothetical protein SAMN03097699_0769 [Flavobacteriaceae bacterium MAR_2010_188]
MKPLLIHEDPTIVRSITNQLRNFRPHLQTMKEKFLLMDMGEYDSETHDFLKSSSINQIRKEYLSRFDYELKNLGVVNSSITDPMKDSFKVKLEGFLDTLQRIKSGEVLISHSNTRKLRFDELKFMENDNDFLVGSEAVEAMTEDEARLYLNTDEEIEFYEIVKDIETKGMELFTRMGSPEYFFKGEFLKLFNFSKDGIEVDPKFVNGYFRHKEIQERVSNRQKERMR